MHRRPEDMDLYSGTHATDDRMTLHGTQVLNEAAQTCSSSSSGFMVWHVPVMSLNPSFGVGLEETDWG